jgi:hypothetical protein
VNPAGACLTRFRVELCGRDVLVDVAAGEGRRHG